MKNPFNHPAWIDISLLLARIALGFVMLLAGWNKMTGPGLSGFVEKGFMPLKPEWLPEALARPYGYVLPIAELVAGLALVLGLFSRIAAGIIALLLLSIAIATISQAGNLSGGSSASIHHSVVYFSLAFVLMVVGSGRLALDPLYSSGAGAADGGKKK